MFDMIFSFQASDFGLELIKEAMTISKITHRPPRLVNSTQRPYILWYAYSADTKRKERKRDYGINKFREETEKRAFAKAYIEDLKYWLEQGYSLRIIGKKGAKIKMPNSEFQAFTITQAIDYALEIKFSYIRVGTQKNYNSTKKYLTNWLKDKGYHHILLGSFNSDLVYGFFDYLKNVLKLSNKTCNNHLANFHAIFQVFVARGIININPCKGIKKLPVDSGSHKPFTKNHLTNIKETITDSGDEQLLLFIYFCYYTLARPHAEVRKIKVEDIREKTILFPGSNSKNRKSSHVIIPHALENLIQKYNLRNYPSHYYIFGRKTPGEYFAGKNYFYNKHLKVLKKTGLSDSGYTLYGYKHTGVINLFNAGADIKDIQKQCRHSKIQHTDNYMKDLGLIRNNDVLNNFPGF